MKAEVLPVRSSKLLKGTHPLHKPEDLKYYMLIPDTYPIGWAAWLFSTNVTRRFPADKRSGRFRRAPQVRA